MPAARMEEGLVQGMNLVEHFILTQESPQFFINDKDAMQVAQRPESVGKTIVTFICDTGKRYVSTELYEGLPDPETA